MTKMSENVMTYCKFGNLIRRKEKPRPDSFPLSGRRFTFHLKMDSCPKKAVRLPYIQLKDFFIAPRYFYYACCPRRFFSGGGIMATSKSLNLFPSILGPHTQRARPLVKGSRNVFHASIYILLLIINVPTHLSPLIEFVTKLLQMSFPLTGDCFSKKEFSPLRSPIFFNPLMGAK